MAQQNHADGRDSTTESKFYSPVGVTPSFGTDRFERLWASLFNHGVGPQK